MPLFKLSWLESLMLGLRTILFERQECMAPTRYRRTATVKAALLLLLCITATVVVRYTPVREYLNPDSLAVLLEAAGFWAPLAYILFFTVGVCLFVPGVVLVSLGAAIFGTFYGFLYGWLGALSGCAAAFYVGRYLGREFAASLVTGKLKEYDDRLEQNGFATVLYLRLAWMPFSPMSYGMGLTKVRFRDFFLGTALGIVVAVFIITHFVGTVKEVWTVGRWEQLLSWKTGVALILVAFSLCLPRLIERYRAARKIRAT